MMMKQHSVVPKKLEQTEDAIALKCKEIQNFTRFIALGNLSGTIAVGLKDAESSLKALEAEKAYLLTQVNDCVYLTPAAIKQRLVGLDKILEKRKQEANLIMRRVFPEKIRMAPAADDKRAYLASGAINLYALQKFQLYVNGGPGRNRTCNSPLGKGRYIHLTTGPGH